MKNLISSILLLVFVIFVNAMRPGPRMPPEMKEMRDVCLEELEMTDEEYHEGKKDGEYEKEDCLRACIAKKMGIIDEDGKIDKEKAAMDFPPHVSRENATKIVATCSEKKGENDCETIVLFQTCLMKLMPPSPMHQKMLKMQNECKDELSYTDEDMKKMRDSRGEMKEDCFLLCMGKKIGFINEDGTVIKEVVVERTPPHEKENVEAIVDECAKEGEGANACETAVLMRKCFAKNHVGEHLFFGPPPPPPPQKMD